MGITNALRLAQQALALGPLECRYHGTDFEKAGTESWERGLPRCDSCKHPYRVTRALAAVERELARLQEDTDVAPGLLTCTCWGGHRGPCPVHGND